jgi:AcrR family transcriptional regulator
MRSETEAKILEAAIELFAESGYSASARDIAERAGSTTMTMYRSFRNSKDVLFEEAIQEVITRSFNPARFLMLMFDDQKARDLPSILTTTLQRWYSEMHPTSARLVAYAYLSINEKWRRMAESAIEKIVEVLASAIERQAGNKTKLDAGLAAKVLITALFQMKMTRSKGRSPKPDKEEAKELDALIKYWLQCLKLGG